MKSVAMAALCAALLGTATAARAYESKDVGEAARQAPGAPDATAPTQAPEGGYTPGEASGSPTKDEWARNEVRVLVTARIVDASRGYPLDGALVVLMRPGGAPHEIAQTDPTGSVHARFVLHDPPPTLKGAGGGAITAVLVRVERPDYLPYEGSFAPGSLPKKGSYGWIDLGDLRMRPVPKEPEE